MDRPRTALIILLLLFIFFSPAGQPSTTKQRQSVDEVIARERHALGILTNSSYGQLDTAQGKWLNLTGLREKDGFAWELLPKVKDRVRNQLDILFADHGTHLISNYGLKESTALPLDHRNKKREDQIGDKKPIVTRPEDPLPLYQNVTGIVRGEWVRSRASEGLKAPHMNVTSFGPYGAFSAQDYDRNITGVGGKVHIRLKEYKGRGVMADGLVREIKAQLTIKDDASNGDGWEMTLHGAHFPEMGQALLATTSEKFSGIFALPHFTISHRTYSLAQSLLNGSLAQTITDQQTTLFTTSSNPWSSSPNTPSEASFPMPHCEYIVYLQQHPMGLKSSKDIKQVDIQNILTEIEEELRHPNGAPVLKAPEIRMSMLIFSPDCGFILESKGPPEYAPQYGNHLHGPKLESYVSSAQRYILLCAALLASQVIVLKRQIQIASTPPTRSRISFYTIAIMSMGDGFAFIAFLMAAIFVDAAFLTLITTAFFAIFAVCFFGMKFLLDIWIAQAPERRERERRVAAANPLPPPAVQDLTTPIPGLIITPAGADTLPLPVTARRPNETGAIPVILPPDQDLEATAADDAVANQTNTGTTGGSVRQELGALYSRFYFLLLAIIFLSFHATTWPTTIRSAYTNLLVFAYLSLWTPQIYRNIMRNCRKALSWEFVVGQSILRLAPFLYVYTVSNNILFIEPDRTAALALVGWVWTQILALISQEVLGPRFAIPDGWTPPAYDYHPILREDDLEAGVSTPIGFTQTSSDTPASPTTVGDSKAKGRWSVDCAICMQNLDVPVVQKGGGGEGSTSAGIGSGILGRRSYMVTPCRHIFHTVCLEGWMKFRLVCPVCREDLPAL